MRRVILESPLAAPTRAEIDANKCYARACLKDCLIKGDAAICFHLLYDSPPEILDDLIPIHRSFCLEASSIWYGSFIEAVVVYVNLGCSPGMQAGINLALDAGIPVEYRRIPWGLPDDSK
jgi:hypothetical protein